MRNRSLVWGAVLGVMANYLLWGNGSGVCFPIFMACAIFATLWNANANGKSLNAGHAYLGICAMVFSAFLAIRGAAGLCFANACLAIYFWFLLNHSIAGETPLQAFGPWDYFRLPRRLVALSLVAGSREMSENYARISGFSNQSDTQKDIRKGVVIALPILAVFLILMVLADSSFQLFVSHTWDTILKPFQNIRFYSCLS